MAPKPAQQCQSSSAPSRGLLSTLQDSAGKPDLTSLGHIGTATATALGSLHSLCAAQELQDGALWIGTNTCCSFHLNKSLIKVDFFFLLLESQREINHFFIAN